MSFKITGLTRSNILALKETMSAWMEDDDLILTTTTATWTRQTPAEALQSLDHVMNHLPTRGHPRASLHAVRRKIIKKLEEDSG